MPPLILVAVTLLGHLFQRPDGTRYYRAHSLTAEERRTARTYRAHLAAIEEDRVRSYRAANRSN